MTKSKLLCYELNEVPWRVIDHYVTRFPGSAFANLLEQSHQFTTATDDVGELHPWSTWPTMHRGVSNDRHGIHSINQNLSCADQYPPIWDLLNGAGVTTGVFGSLQSFPPLDNATMAFHVPDTFAPESDTVPAKYEPFQSFNLSQTSNNKAVAGRVDLADVAKVVPLLKTGISVGSMMKIGQHLVKEKVNPLHKSRRPLLQSHLAFDVFLNCMATHKPSFVTFFTNHVAGMMHRYWKFTFPEDFDNVSDDQKVASFHAKAIDAGMHIADAHIRHLMAFCDKHEYELIVSSSMGQEAIERGEYIPEFDIKDFSSFSTTLGFAGKMDMKLAMHPNVSLHFADNADLQAFQLAMPEVKDSDGVPLIEQAYPPDGGTLDIKLKTSSALARDGEISFNSKRYNLADLGLVAFERDIGTGYHQPEGIWIWRNNRDELSQSRKTVNSRTYAPTILSQFGVNPPDYMSAPVNF